MKIANPAQLTNFLWNEKNKFPLTAIQGSVANGFRVDDTELFPWLMKFQQWLSDFNDYEDAREREASTTTLSGEQKGVEGIKHPVKHLCEHPNNCTYSDCQCLPF